MKQTAITRIQFGDEYDAEKMRRFEESVSRLTAAIQRLERILAGGTQGQVLTKNSDRDLDASFQ
jgi:hypothetical protein